MFLDDFSCILQTPRLSCAQETAQRILMRTEKQIEASRLNGAKSHGPRGPRLKSANAHHKALARSLLLPGESRSEFMNFIETVFMELAPDTPVEHMLVEKLAVAQWCQMRLWIRQTSALAADLAVPRSPGESSRQRTAMNQQEVRLDMQFGRALDRLTKLRTARTLATAKLEKVTRDNPPKPKESQE